MGWSEIVQQECFCISFQVERRMENDHDDVQEHDCCVDMNVVQSRIAPDREIEDS